MPARARVHGAEYFGVALHEHDLCPEGSLEPAAEALEALSAWLDSRVGPSLDCAPPQDVRTVRTAVPLSDRFECAGFAWGCQDCCFNIAKIQRSEP